MRKEYAEQLAKFFFLLGWYFAYYPSLRHTDIFLALSPLCKSVRSLSEAEGGRGDDDLKLDDEDDEFKDGYDAKGDGDPGEGQDNEYFVAPVRGVPPIQH